MSKKIIFISKIVAYALMGVAAIFQIFTFIYGGNYASATPEAMASPLLGNYLIMGYIVLGIAVIVALVFPSLSMVSNPKGALRSLLWIAVIAALGFISYLMSSNELSAVELERLQVAASMSVWVGAGLYLTYIVGLVTFAAAIFLAVKGIISK
jgi:hypothetical protein